MPEYEITVVVGGNAADTFIEDAADEDEVLQAWGDWLYEAVPFRMWVRSLHDGKAVARGSAEAFRWFEAPKGKQARPRV